MTDREGKILESEQEWIERRRLFLMRAAHVDIARAHAVFGPSRCIV